MAWDPCSGFYGKEEDLKPKEDDSPVKTMADLAGVKAFNAPDGRVVAKFENGWGAFRDDEHAIAGLKDYAKSKFYRARTEALIKGLGVNREFFDPGQGPMNVEGYDPQVGAALSAFPNPDLGTMGRVTTGLHDRSSISKAWRMVGDKSQEYLNRGVNAFSGGTGTTQHPGAFNVLVPQRVLSSISRKGEELALRYQYNNDMKYAMQAWAARQVHDITSVLTEEEKQFGLHDYAVHNIVNDPARQKVYDAVLGQLRAIQDRYYDWGSRLGLKMAPKQEVYDWPRRYDLTSLGNPHTRARDINSLMAAGLAASPDEAAQLIDRLKFGGNRGKVLMSIADYVGRQKPKNTPEQSLAEAQLILDKFVRGKGDRFASSLERERTLPGDDNYIKDTRAWHITFAENSKRLSEAYWLGPQDQYFHQLFGEMKTDGMTPIQEAFVRDLHDFETGRKRADVPGYLRSLMDWQQAKLSLSAIWNLTGNANTALRAGFAPFVKGTANWAKAILTQGPKGMLADVAESGALGGVPGFVRSPDVHVIATKELADISQHGLANSIPANVWNAMKNMTLKDWIMAPAKALASPFNLVEQYINRGLAYHVGEQYVDYTVRNLLSAAPGSAAEKLGLKRLGELGFDVFGDAEKGIPSKVSTVLDGLRNGDQEASKALDEWRQMGAARIIRDTQFRPDVMNLPAFAQSPIGRAFAQFKSYPVNQLRFLMREINYPQHQDPARFFRAIAGIGLAYPTIAYGLMRVRANIMGETEISKQINKFMNEPGVGGKVAAGALALTTSGMMGLMFDVGATAMVGNKFQQTGLTQFPALTTVMNGMAASAALGKGLYNHKSQQVQEGLRDILAEFGGAGQYAIKTSQYLRPKR